MSEGLSPKKIVPIVYVIAMFMAAMDATIVNVALRTISGEMQVTPSAASVVNVGYLLSLSVLLPVSGWLGDRFGSKRIFALALLLFTGASALCGLAGSLTSLTWFRVLQGAGGGLMTPTGMAMLFRTFPPQERAALSRYLVLPIALAPALGPIIGGLFTSELSWRWGFYINVPLGVAALLLCGLFVREHREPDAGRLDVRGLLLAAPGFALLVYALHEGGAYGWSSPLTAAAGACGALLLAALVVHALRVPKPLLDLRLLAVGSYRTSGIVAALAAAGLLGLLYVFPLMYQDVMHASALEAGLITFPEALGLMAASQLMPRSYKRLGPRNLIAWALAGTAVIFTALGLIDPAVSPWALRALLFGVGLLLGHAVGAVQLAAFAELPPPAMGRATTLYTVQNRLGGALGLALLASLLGAVGGGGADGVYAPVAYRVALLGAAGLLVAALGFALRLRAAAEAGAARGPAAGAPAAAARPASAGTAGGAGAASSEG